MLFEASGRSVSQADINSVAHTLGCMVGRKRVMSSIARLMGKQELERAQLRHTQDEEIQKMEAKETQAPQDCLMDDDDWMAESGNEEDLNMDEEDEDGSIALDGEDVRPQSATV
jgi:Na+-translocating ferredoxin:NAD+ oxidoreductase RNF subunit RnfB